MKNENEKWLKIKLTGDLHRRVKAGAANAGTTLEKHVAALLEEKYPIDEKHKTAA
jgi:hypothetical protein